MENYLLSIRKDEVQELIEKERSLLSLKLIDQQHETNEWKKKYDNLLSNIRNPHISINELKIRDQTTSVEDDVTAWFDVKEVHERLQKQDFRWIADLNRSRGMTPQVFAKVCKYIFGVRSPFGRDKSVAWFSNCNISDECIPSLQFVFRSPYLEAIDLSHNNLTASFIAESITTLKVIILYFRLHPHSLILPAKDRSKTPQYILLEGNMSLTKEFADPITQLVDALTEETWGLSLSLPDFPHTLIPDNGGEVLPQSKTAPNRDYRELYSPPYSFHLTSGANPR